MSIETLTCDEFARFGLPEHYEAIDLYDRAVREEAATLPTVSPGSPIHSESLDRMCRLLSLRKVHQARRDELEDERVEQETEEEGFALASERYERNDRQPLSPQ